MTKRILIACVLAGGSLAFAVPLAAGAGSQAASVPAACVVVTGPGGVNIQAGYAPNGPSDCTQL